MLIFDTGKLLLVFGINCKNFVRFVSRYLKPSIGPKKNMFHVLARPEL